MNSYHEPARDLPVIETDVLVAGAGTAGCIAAIAAAREGAKVLLIEKLPVPTGTLGNGGNSLFSFFNASYDPAKAKRIVGGLPYEFFKRCVDEGVAYDFIATPNNRHAVPYSANFNRESVKGVLCMMLREAGVQVLLQTMLADIVMENGHIRYALIENKDGRSAIKANTFIDCTGDADIAKHAGLELLTNWQIYDQVCGGPTSLNLGLAGIDFDKALREAPDVFTLLYECKEPGKYIKRYRLRHLENPERCKNLCKLDLRHFTTFTSFSEGEATSINNSKGPMIDASTAEGLTKAEMDERIKMLKFMQALKQDIPGFENCHMIWEGIQLGIRSSKIIVCEKMMSWEEIAAASRYEDEIGLYGFQDMVEKDPSTMIREPGYYGVPYRMIVPKGCLNLYVAGRCVTHDVMAHNSTRNTVSCMIMGQAAGIAAGLCAQRGYNTITLPYEMLREELLKQGVILDADSL